MGKGKKDDERKWEEKPCCADCGVYVEDTYGLFQVELSKGVYIYLCFDCTIKRERNAKNQ